MNELNDSVLSGSITIMYGRMDLPVHSGMLDVTFAYALRKHTRITSIGLPMASGISDVNFAHVYRKHTQHRLAE